MSGSRQRGRPPHDDVLTPAQAVVEAVRHGMSNAAIAARRGISRDAVKFHIANALSKLGLTRRAELRHWDGIARHSALAAKETMMGEALSLGSLGQIARPVTDIAAARRFFGEVLGLTHLYSFGDLAFYDCDGVRLMLSAGDGGDPGAVSILYFRVPDIHAAHAAFSARGVTFAGAPHMIHRHADGTEEWMAFFHDNEGRPLAIMAQANA